ncbi:glyoxalase superfamily protein [Bdellovibrio bacteriovorus]|uniref:glyoxalase superfamily protein n=1 Tax=Bdellovibrio bacteriovorus TaxID=959 RepID=UPI0035A5EFC3
MSAGTSTLEALKERAKVIRSFLKEKYGIDVSHSHCVEMASKVFGFKDWNTASAMLKPKEKKKVSFGAIETVGQMRETLAPFKDSDYIDGMFEYKVKDLLESAWGVEAEGLEPDNTLTQQFSFSLDHFDERQPEPRFVSFKLTLEDETMSFTD